MATIETHTKMVQALKSKDYEPIMQRMVATPEIVDIQHALMGLFSEGGELADAVKRHIFYGTNLDATNLKEESGDLLWYIQLLIKAMNWSMEEVMDVNMAKLAKRYGDKFEFTEHAAVHRDLEGERAVLEGEIPSTPLLNEIPVERPFIKNLGKMPVPEGTLIDLVHKSGTVYLAQACGSLYCEMWGLGDSGGTIDTWRLAKDQRGYWDNIGHEGDDMPVEVDTLIDFIHQDGTKYFNEAAGTGFCNYWGLEDGPGTIKKWRLAE